MSTNNNKMASGGNEGSSGFQQFPLVPSSIPDDQEMKERIALALNLKDGQQSLGQSVEDPYTRAVKYIEKHRIVEVLQVTMATIYIFCGGLVVLSCGFCFNIFLAALGRVFLFENKS